MQLADRTLILKQKEFFVFIIATRLLWNHSPSEWFSLYKKIVRRKGNSADDFFAGEQQSRTGNMRGVTLLQGMGEEKRGDMA